MTRYWHTLRYLRPVQIYGRLWFRVFRPRPNVAAAPAQARARSRWVTPARRTPSMTGPAAFSFVGISGSLDDGWEPAGFDELWRYNLNYFDDLTAFDAPTRAPWHAALIARWVAENEPGKGVGWDPYPLSLRMVNWIKWALAGNQLEERIRQSLAIQARWLARRIEYHLQGNHLFANAKALLFAGAFFEGEEAAQWAGIGERVLVTELPEQVLADGGHFERSPMYHALILEDLLDLVNLRRAYGHDVPVAWCDAAARMLTWLHGMSHPDGAISFFNDAAFGIAPENDELIRYARELGITDAAAPGSGRYADSGYVRLEAGPAVALLDIAPIGPDHLPAHAHADTLSFELSLFGQRVFVNSGTSCYGSGPERLRQRGTAAHNTVVVDGADSSEVWSGFRVARRARPVDPVVDGMTVRCGHDGYLRLPGRVVHTRGWQLGQHALQIDDVLDGRFGRAEARFHLHPEVTVGERDGGYLLCLPGGRQATLSVEGGDARVDAAHWHPRFGAAVASSCIAVAFRGPELRTTITWTGA